MPDLGTWRNRGEFQPSLYPPMIQILARLAPDIWQNRPLRCFPRHMMDAAAILFLRFEVTQSMQGIPRVVLHPPKHKFTLAYKTVLLNMVQHPAVQPWVEGLKQYDFTVRTKWPEWLKGHPLTSLVAPSSLVYGLPDTYPPPDPHARWVTEYPLKPHLFSFHSAVLFCVLAGWPIESLQQALCLAEGDFNRILRDGITDLWKDPRIRLWAFNVYADCVPTRNALLLTNPEKVAQWVRSPFSGTKEEFEEDFNTDLMTDAFLARQPPRPTKVQLQSLHWLYVPVSEASWLRVNG